MTLKRFVRLFYAYQFFFTLLLWLPVFYEFQKRIGLSDAEIFRIQTIYYIVFCLLEIPTGWIADRFGRLRCMRAGAWVLVLANVLPIFWQSYLGFMVHFLSVGLARSLVSGAGSAYLYDRIRREGDYKQAEGNARAYNLAGKVVFWAGMGWLMEMQLTLPYTLTAGATAVAVVIAYLLPHEEKTSTSDRHFLRDLGPVARMVWSSRYLQLVILQGIPYFILGRIAHVNLLQPILGDRGFSLSSYGWVLSVLTLSEALGSRYPALAKSFKLGDLNAVFVLSALMGLSVAGIAYSGAWAAMLGLVLFSFFCGVAFPIQRQVLNDAITDSRYRATLLSLESLVDRASSAAVVAFLGGFVASGRMNQFLLLCGVVTVIWMIVGYVLSLKTALKINSDETPDAI